MPTLIIAPLATPKSVTEAALNAVNSAQRLFAQTLEHPCARVLPPGAVSLDYLYRQSADFDELNRAVAETVLAKGDAVYAVPGRGPGEAQLRAICKRAAETGTEVRLLPSSGYAEAAMAEIFGFPYMNARVYAANALPVRFETSEPCCIEEVDTFVRAAEVKLALLEYYPGEYTVYFAVMDDTGSYVVSPIRLYELDRKQGSYFAATALIIPPAEFEQLERHGIDSLMRVLERLRAPGGCPWDREQTHDTLKSALLEETYEVLDAIERADDNDMVEELGDLMMQVCFHAVIGSERSAFGLRDITTGVVDKLVYRHPHVFGDATVMDSGEVLKNWDRLKRKEKKQASASEVLRAVPESFPALMYADKVQRKASMTGFDWSEAEEALHKISEEAGELREAIACGRCIEEELGDLLFSVVNVARHLNIEAETALRKSTVKFIRRFTKMEEAASRDGRNLESMTLAEMDEYWVKIKLEGKQV